MTERKLTQPLPILLVSGLLGRVAEPSFISCSKADQP